MCSLRLLLCHADICNLSLHLSGSSSGSRNYTTGSIFYFGVHSSYSWSYLTLSEYIFGVVVTVVELSQAIVCTLCIVFGGGRTVAQRNSFNFIQRLLKSMRWYPRCFLTIAVRSYTCRLAPSRSAAIVVHNLEILATFQIYSHPRTTSK